MSFLFSKVHICTAFSGRYFRGFVSHFLPDYLCVAIVITQVIFNGLILIVVWPWVYVAYRRVLTTLRAKYRGQEARNFFSSSFS